MRASFLRRGVPREEDLARHPVLFTLGDYPHLEAEIKVDVSRISYRVVESEDKLDLRLLYKQIKN